MYGEVTTATWSRPGQPEQEGVAAARPSPGRHRGWMCEDATIIHLTRRGSSHAAALSLADMELDSRKNFLTTLEPGFRWVRAFSDDGRGNFGSQVGGQVGGTSLLLFQRGEKAAKLGGGSEPPTPPQVSQAPSEHLSSAAWPGTAGAGGVVGGSFQLHLCLGKLLHVAACDLSRRPCRRGRPEGAGGGVTAQGTLTPCTRQTAAPAEASGDGEGPPRGVGMEAWPAGGTQAGGPALPRLAAGLLAVIAADGLGQSSLACLQVWGGWLWCQPPRGVCRDSASLSSFAASP